jgi:hypothetical protein
MPRMSLRFCGDDAAPGVNPSAHLCALDETRGDKLLTNSAPRAHHAIGAHVVYGVLWPPHHRPDERLFSAAG